MKVKSINTFAAKEYIVSPAEYLKLSGKEKANIKSVSIVPPRLGDNGFGKFLIQKKTPLYTSPF